MDKVVRKVCREHAVGGQREATLFHEREEGGERKRKATELPQRLNEVTASPGCQVPDSLAVKSLQVPGREQSD